LLLKRNPGKSAQETGGMMKTEGSPEYRRFGGSARSSGRDERGREEQAALSVGFILTNNFTLTALSTFPPCNRLSVTALRNSLLQWKWVRRKPTGLW
jgi:hypothetical protein